MPNLEEISCGRPGEIGKRCRPPAATRRYKLSAMTPPPDSPLPAGNDRTDESYMRRCLELAADSARIGETPVGSLIARDGRILGEGLEGVRAFFDPTAHAEVQALRAAGRRQETLDLSGSTLYTTVEPCVLCAYAIRRAGVSRVVYGVPAGQAGGATSRYGLLNDGSLDGWPPPPEIVAGVLQDECREILARSSGKAT